MSLAAYKSDVGSRSLYWALLGLVFFVLGVFACYVVYLAANDHSVGTGQLVFLGWMGTLGIVAGVAIPISELRKKKSK